MPPKPSITKEQIEAAAFEITRAEGLESLTARRIASALGCSTQPVYTACESMEAIVQSVRARALRVAMEYFGAEQAAVPPFLRMGHGTLRLAHEEPRLFRLISDFMRTAMHQLPEPVRAAMRASPELADLPDASLQRIHTLLWTFSLGLTAMVPANATEETLAQAREHLRIAGEAIIEYEQRRASSAAPLPLR